MKQSARGVGPQSPRGKNTGHLAACEQEGSADAEMKAGGRSRTLERLGSAASLGGFFSPWAQGYLESIFQTWTCVSMIGGGFSSAIAGLPGPETTKVAAVAWRKARRERW